jgi:nucleotide-binding universal stress UspA family protein
MHPTKILVPTDFSEYSDKALSEAFVMAKQYNAEVYVLHVIHAKILETFDDYGLVYPSHIRDIETDMINVARVKLQKEADKFPQTKELDVFIEVAFGHPSEEILKAATEKGIDLIVIASLGRTGVARYFVGSVALNVLKGSTCPVLLMK